MAKTVTQVVEKYRRNVAAAGNDYVAGVQNPKADWLSAYAKAQPRMTAAIQAALAAGKPLKGAQQSGGTGNWQAKALSKGARNYVAAAEDAAQGYQAKADKILAAGEAARAAARALPDTNQEQRIQRAVAAMKAISKYWGGS